MEGNGRNGLDQALKQLNQAQRRVVEELEQSLLVMAPAGTGKTNVIALRTAKFIEAGIQPSQILCLTFTNKACYELKDRLTKVIGVKSKGIVVKTFHSLCYQLVSPIRGGVTIIVPFKKFGCRMRDTCLLVAVWKLALSRIPTLFKAPPIFRF